ncbi:MAG TPA: ComEC/Rec2 family competence protein, partial [Chitinophagales bacterium]
QAYASSGALHVLSVSGLHVGVLFIGLQFVFGFMNNRGKRWRYAQAAIFISIMMLYAVLTGLSPSVLRAVVMFSFFVLAKAINRNANMYNILAVSCLLLLLYNPYLITEIGFKLSYLAVLGIVIFYPMFYNRLQFKNKFVDGAWSITCLSLAAQLTTFPVSLYYFHQFPNLFLISNLIVIPISDFILYSGMLLFLVYKIPFVFDIIGNIFYWLIFAVNKFIYFIDKLPFALIEEIQVSQTEMYLLYLMMALVLLYIYIPKSKYFLWVTCSIVLFAGVRAARLINNEAQHSFVVYSVPHHSALCFVNNTQIYTEIDSALLNDENNMLFHIKKHWWAMGLNENLITKNPDFLRVFQLPFGTLYEFRGRKILQLTQTVSNTLVAEKLEVDEIVLSNNQPQKIENLNNLFSFRKIIFDSSNGFYKIKKWREDCAKENIAFYDVNEYAYIEEY